MHSPIARIPGNIALVLPVTRLWHNKDTGFSKLKNASYTTWCQELIGSVTHVVHISKAAYFSDSGSDGL